jgi:hypothetical protein
MKKIRLEVTSITGFLSFYMTYKVWCSFGRFWYRHAHHRKIDIQSIITNRKLHKVIKITLNVNFCHELTNNK